MIPAAGTDRRTGSRGQEKGECPLSGPRFFTRTHITFRQPEHAFCLRGVFSDTKKFRVRADEGTSELTGLAEGKLN
jgi:hypothetical protein